MFFLLSKLLHIFVSPLTWIFVLLIWATLSSKKRKGLVIASLSLVFFFGNSFILNLFLRSSEWPATSINTVEAHEVGIVLGGFSTYDTKLDRVEFYAAADRLLAAVQLYRAKKIDHILLSGGANQIGDDKVYEMKHVQDWLVSIGIPKRAIWVDSQSRNTYENAAETMKILDREEVSPSECLLITSAIHMKRSMDIFAKMDAHPTPYSVDRFAGEVRFKGIESFLPNVEAIWHWEALIHEWIGRIAYRLKGYS